MSAYMPVKPTLGIHTLRPRGWSVSLAGWVFTVSVIAAAVIGLVMLFIAAVREPGLSELPSGGGGQVSSLGVVADRDHGFIVVQGMARNESAKTARNLEAVVELFDRFGALKSVEGAMVTTPSIAPRGEGAFVVRMPDPGEVQSYRIRFRSLGRP